MSGDSESFPFFALSLSVFWFCVCICRVDVLIMAQSRSGYCEVRRWTDELQSGDY